MHIPVLKDEIIGEFNYLASKKKFVFVDGTIGNAGHSLALAKKYLGDDSKIIGIDQDLSAIELSKRNIVKDQYERSFILIHNNFKNICDILADQKIAGIDGALIDLGVSSMQLDQVERGFSFRDSTQALDMRMDQTKNKDAAYVINNYSIEALAEILLKYGEEKFAKRIAQNIVTQRKIKPIKTVGDLLSVIDRSIPDKMKYGRIHYATKTFQAIRIEVNDELTGLDKAIIEYVNFLSKGSKLAILTFHSLEDRIVKNTFRKLENPCQCPAELPCVCGLKPKVRILTKKPVLASDEEIDRNPRSRSAKLRIVEKI